MSSPKKTKQQKKPLSPKEARLGPLVRQGDIAARNELILDHLSTVEKVLKTVFAPKMGRSFFHDMHEDLMSVGTIALFNAAKTWNYQNGPFFQYAWTPIERDVRHHLHMNETVARKRSQIDDHERNPKIATTSLYLVINSEKGAHDREVYLVDTLEDRFRITPEQYAETADELIRSRKRIRDLLTTLNEQELSDRNRNIFLSFWRLNDSGNDWGVKQTLDGLGRVFGVSGTRIDQIVTYVLEKISGTYTREDLERDIATILVFREVVEC